MRPREKRRESNQMCKDDIPITDEDLCLSVCVSTGAQGSLTEH